MSVTCCGRIHRRRLTVYINGYDIVLRFNEHVLLVLLVLLIFLVLFMLVLMLLVLLVLLLVLLVLLIRVSGHSRF